MALCLTLNSSSFSIDLGEFKEENLKIIKFRTYEFREKVILKNLVLNKFLKNLLTDDPIFDGKK